MGLLNYFRGNPAPALQRLPNGTFTVDREGRVLISTLSSGVPAVLLRDIGRAVLATFREAHEAGVPLAELIVRYAGFKITARELRGGAIVFLLPQSPLAAKS